MFLTIGGRQLRLNEVAKNYDRAARYYDCMADAVFGFLLGLEKYRTQVINQLGSLEGATVLDLGCGTGRNFSLLEKSIGESGKIIAVDYSDGMLRKARRRIKRNAWSNIEVVRDDVVTLRKIQEPVDAVVAIWVSGIVHDLDSALNEAVKRLLPNGRIAIMDFEKSRPDRGFLRWLFPFYSLILRASGIDTEEDLDNSRLQAKWKRGKKTLDEQLIDLRIDDYLCRTGLIVSGMKPENFTQPITYGTHFGSV